MSNELPRIEKGLLVCPDGASWKLEQISGVRISKNRWSDPLHPSMVFILIVVLVIYPIGLVFVLPGILYAILSRQTCVSINVASTWHEIYLSEHSLMPGKIKQADQTCESIRKIIEDAI